MKNFYRSLRYLWPYKGRLGVAVVCVIIISVLWGGGIGMMLPGAKVLLAPEGLHGWAWLSMTQDRLNATIVRQEVPPGSSVDGQPIVIVLNVVDVSKDGKADRAGLPKGWWLVGRGRAGNAGPADSRPAVAGSVELVRGDVLAKEIAHAADSSFLNLAVYDPGSKTLKAITVKMDEPSLVSHWLGRAADTLAEPKDFPERFTLFVYLLLAVLGLTVVRAVFTYIQEYLIGTVIWQGIMDLRNDNYNVVLQLPLTFFAENINDTTSRFIADTGELARGQNTLLGKTLIEPAKALSCLAIALLCSWKLTLLAMVAGPPAFFLIQRFGKSMHKASKRALESWSTMLATLNETLSGIRVVKAYTMEGSERKRFFRVNRQLYKQQSKMERLDALTGPVVEVLGMIAGMLAAGIAGFMVFNRQMDTEVFLTWMVALFALFDPVRKLAKVAMRFEQADAAAKRIFDLQDMPQQKRVANAPTLPRHSKSLEFRGVSYRYPNAGTDSLKNINLSIRAGQTVAIVGPNGSGKTTMVSLVPRLLDPTQGAVFLDALDIAGYSVRSLRRQIGLVTQETVLFHATIAENISYGLRRPRREKVIEASRKAFVDEFVRDLPEGYETMVGEFGATLSGGQKQRISIARAILRDPAILIFDEAMSQVDSDSERRIHEVMQEFSKGRTTLLIAHRFATVLSADMIVVLDDGRIIGTGTHDELLKSCQLYHHLYQTQFTDSGG
ncbi:MAG: ABC transporter ATP-binding protein [Planctomycetes bacterium]|nr:ABC transporter ATP-binding protein [Planctomycetota bacterium]